MTLTVDAKVGQRTPFDEVEILDCTLRDGSYAVDFQFDVDTITGVLSGLEAAGVGLVELGHGLGLNAGEKLGKPSLVSDEQCFDIAAAILDDAEWGMFCIPGIATLDHLRQAAAAGMRFVRVGVDITEVEPAQDFLGLAKSLGLRAFANLMKTNVLDPRGVAEAVRRCAGFGADAVYLVDSVGGYLPHEITELVAEVVRGGTPLGFHGHDNLGMANANALAAARSGVRYIDVTLDGIGRGAGNANTEMFAAVLSAESDRSRYDYRALSRLSETRIRGLKRLHSDRTFMIAGGLTQTHSSFFPLITKCALEHGVDVFDLMAEVALVERINPTEDLVRNVATALVADPRLPVG
ncbi:hypothetical protein [Catenulispora rubra]|uniref:hypothetical protein n=1 Tax=Catenulispora rubra TaxID=280293 RepID=UPI001891F897|nr:hypothetical protein [Catenulispora rubra]